MKILIEGEKYNIEDLESNLSNPNFYIQKGLNGYVNSVGYYHSFEKKELVYMLPKVFMKEGETTVFGLTKTELYNFDSNHSFKHRTEYRWVRQLLIYFYNSLKEYKRRYSDNIIIELSQSLELNTNLSANEYTYLDLLLSFVNFYKKNKVSILFKHIDFKSNQAKKPKWDKTIRKSLPIIINNNCPIYTEISNKKRVVNTEEELLTYFFSILNHFNEEHTLQLKLDPSFSLIKGYEFTKLQKNGLSKLRKIKHRYFSDTLRKMYQLCEIYFHHTDQSSIKKKKEEFISVKNYNIIFEDMVDKLFSDNLNTVKEYGETLNDLKYNNDGKIIDHIYEYQSLIDTSNIFYIGDSKYYKSNSDVGTLSKYKQFTYAKNVIQFNIDLLNEGRMYKENIRYRDEITEGYNLTPNFFIFGYIDNVNTFDEPELTPKNTVPIKSYHFADRLFDRDTLFVHQYKINFLFVLKAYSSASSSLIDKFRDKAKKQFRENFIDFFNSPAKSGFTIYEKEMSEYEAKEFVNANFRALMGKCYYTNDNKLLIANNNLSPLLLTNFTIKNIT